MHTHTLHTHTHTLHTHTLHLRLFATFALSHASRHYFMEVNPRIQVEHTVTEQVTGVDLVQSQLRIAGGASLQDLELSQDTISTRGFSIQARITTEDPLNDFAPDTGTALSWCCWCHQAYSATRKCACVPLCVCVLHFTISMGTHVLLAMFLIQAASRHGDQPLALASVWTAVLSMMVLRFCPFTTACLSRLDAVLPHV